MQDTLAEVELTAVSGTHVFGEEHATALEQLRTAQIALAQAWARSEADDGVEGREWGDEDDGEKGKEKEKEMEGKRSRRGSMLEEETKSDLALARKRREANDRYFARVNGGVLDVVAKLEEVAVAMRAVERESRDIWSESESVGTSIS